MYSTYHITPILAGEFLLSLIKVNIIVQLYDFYSLQKKALRRRRTSPISIVTSMVDAIPE